ncbi:YfhO family protein [Candidatus Sumerlaeota bacterium]|nr:YfhO family protein [Candidatus Sumerlaeota bacterium]
MAKTSAGNVRRISALNLALMALAYIAFGMVTTRGIFNGGFGWDEGLSEYIPWRVEVGRQIAAGHFPFFTKNVLGGMPLFSLGYVGVLYPPNLLYAVCPPQVANWLQLFHSLVGGMGMLSYLRARRLATPACFIGGLLFIANSFMILHAGHISMREAAMLSPWVALMALRVLRHRTVRAAIALTLVLALQIAAGYMQVTLFTVAWIGVDWLAAARWSRRFAWATGLLAAGGAAGFALMALQILPTMQHVSQTPRVHMTLEGWQTASLPPVQLPSLLYPRILGMDGSLVSYPGETIVTIPAVGWVLAAVLLGLVWQRRLGSGRRRVLAVVYTLVIVLCVVLSFGKFLALNAVLFHWPPFNMFRVPARWLFLGSTLGSVLAAMGLHLFMRLGPRSRVIGVLLGIFFIVLCSAPVFAILNHVHPQKLDVWAAMMRGTGVGDGRVAASLFGEARRQSCSFVDAPIFQMLLSLSCLVSLIFVRRRPRISLSAILLLLGLDNYILSQYGVSAPIPRDQILSLDKQPLFRQVDASQIVRIYGLSPHGDNLGEFGAPHDTALFLDLPTLNGYTPLLSDRIYITLGVGQSGVSHRDLEYYDRPTPLRNVAVSHLIVQTNALSPERKTIYEKQLKAGVYYERIASAFGYDLLMLKGARPRFDFAPQWTPPSGSQSQLDTRVFHNNPGNIAPAAILERPRWKLLPPADTPIRGATAKVLLDDPSHQRVRVHAPEGAVLLIRDVHWKGWKYKIEGFDDAYHTVGRADGLIRYVPVPKGDWVVDMKFAPPGWTTGLAISMVTALLLLMGLGTQSQYVKARRR